ncbi:MAG: TlpA disulfide reductase family protein [Myxococcota bacterium]
MGSKRQGAAKAPNHDEPADTTASPSPNPDAAVEPTATRDVDASASEAPAVPHMDPVTRAPEVADPMKSEKSWEVGRGLKAAFFWGSVVLVAALVGYKVDERIRYEKILVDTVMDPTPMNRPAPQFTLADGEGNGRVSLADLRGQYVFVNFWATWCPPCREEMPSMEYMARKFGKDMKIVAISVDEDWNEVKRFFGNDKPTFELLWDPQKKVTSLYGTEKFPESYIVDPYGNVVVKFVGPRDWNNEASVEYFRRLLKRS